ncbi:ATP-dependent RNA helicase DDX55-like protein [Dinothrombium tinctorium]|uniref:ATP-dependent RNA helicase n=1 Tax=Dinothrombium tinctorium TaxID=1965070 RepID=A0A443R989_9ACAR|nr:ATP-dependent RNA helicase DDX55-like protein [Dinothrombium tinctorium]RWS11828.1 ATP-dependent RNA helicase DDX55-like protein [Dinothrombium tinctorium]
MTPVQSATIPLFIANKDVIVEAVTGSGKTLAFLLPILQMVITKNTKLLESERKALGKYDISAIVISPTRELASQTYSVLRKFLAFKPLNFISSLLFIGGNSAVKDYKKFEENGAHIIVSTPGRLYELLYKFVSIRDYVKKNLEMLILDEADILLEMGFEKSLNHIFSNLPKQRRTGLFSATQTKQLTQLIRAGLRNPVKIEIKSKNAVKKESSFSKEHLSEEGQKLILSTGLEMSPYLTNSYVILKSSCDKLPFVIRFLTLNCTAKCLLFMATCAQVDYFSAAFEKCLKSTSVKVYKIHRKMKKKRQKIFDDFKLCVSGCVLLCTDVMSRGVDIPSVDWVLHFDLPNTLQSYIHRSGRSGHQVGQKGNSLLMCLPHEVKFVNLCIEKGIELIEKDAEDNNLVQMKEKLVKWMQNNVRESAAFYESSMKAFVSFIRTYNSKNIMCQTLFKELDVVDVANSYGLIKIPIMPELKGKLKTCASKFLRNDRDKEIASKHKEEMQSKKVSDERTEEQRLNKQRLKLKRQRMRKKINSSKLQGKKKKRLIDELELKELEEDAKMVKKLKKGKISEQQFDLHFGSGNCPQCGINLRRTNFRLQLFDDSFVEKEIDIRKRILKDFNKLEEDFDSLDEYNDYLEQVERIIYNLANNVDVEATKRRIEQYKKENADTIVRNRSRMSKDAIFIEELLEEEKAQNQWRTQYGVVDEKDISKAKVREKEALVDELMYSDLPANQILALHSHEKRQTESQPQPPIRPPKPQAFFSTGIKVGQGGNIFAPIPTTESQPYHYVEPKFNLLGPNCPKQEELESDGYLLHIRTIDVSEKAGGFIQHYPCTRALQEAFCGLYFKLDNKS